MEFIREVASPTYDINSLKRLANFENLTKLCASIDSVTPKNNEEAEIFCLWGTFELRRDELKCGVRFSLIDCPHAFAWTITYDQAREIIVIHCALDKTELDPDFLESIHEFASDWEAGIRQVIVETGKKFG